MSDDELYSYVPEVEETYSDEETQEAMKLINENNFPMSDLLVALKYVRLSNRDVKLDGMFQGLRDRLKKLRENNIPVVTPP